MPWNELDDVCPGITPNREWNIDDDWCGFNYALSEADAEFVFAHWDEWQTFDDVPDEWKGKFSFFRGLLVKDGRLIENP